VKVNIICGGHAITGYVNIDPLAKNEPDKIAADFGNLDNLIHDSEATEILATEVVQYIPFTSVPKVLENWAKKLRINGKISVGGYDATEACKSYANKTCSLEDLNILLYGDPSTPIANSSAISMPFIKNILENLGLKILKQRKNGHHILVEAVREK
jgi:hypothetical protein|tara:strand:+ start:347 stop:814 length:468 start_codon:yes stop_codon:yes gene_type:complete